MNNKYSQKIHDHFASLGNQHDLKIDIRFFLLGANRTETLVWLYNTDDKDNSKKRAEVCIQCEKATEYVPQIQYTIKPVDVNTQEVDSKTELTNAINTIKLVKDINNVDNLKIVSEITAEMVTNAKNIINSKVLELKKNYVCITKDFAETVIKNMCEKAKAYSGEFRQQKKFLDAKASVFSIGILYDEEIEAASERKCELEVVFRESSSRFSFFQNNRGISKTEATDSLINRFIEDIPEIKSVILPKR